jgi:Domain of unknown function (DUF4833)
LRKVVFVIFIHINFLFFLQLSAQEVHVQKVFHIEKSQSPNIVVYNVNILAKEKKFTPKKSVDGFWWNTEEHYRYELNWLEKLVAYGFEYDLNVNHTQITFRIKGLKKYPVKIFINQDGKVLGQLSINGKPSYIEKVYIKVAKHLYPPLDYIDIHGFEISTGKSIVERIYAR